MQSTSHIPNSPPPNPQKKRELPQQEGAHKKAKKSHEGFVKNNKGTFAANGETKTFCRALEP